MPLKAKRAVFQKLKHVPGVVSALDMASARRASEVVQALKTWRNKNKLSQRQAISVMGARDFPLRIETLRTWEQGRYLPEPITTRALEDFLAQHPVIRDAPAYGKRTKFSSGDVAEIKRLREEGATMVAIGTRFKVDESYISRILAGERLAKITV